MKKIPWKAIVIGCLVAVVLIVGRCAVTVSKAFYYGYDWITKLVNDPWFYVGIVMAAVGLGAVAALAVQSRKNKQDL